MFKASYTYENNPVFDAQQKYDWFHKIALQRVQQGFDGSKNNKLIAAVKRLLSSFYKCTVIRYDASVLLY